MVTPYPLLRLSLVMLLMVASTADLSAAPTSKPTGTPSSQPTATTRQVDCAIRHASEPTRAVTAQLCCQTRLSRGDTADAKTWTAIPHGPAERVGQRCRITLMGKPTIGFLRCSVTVEGIPYHSKPRKDGPTIAPLHVRVYRRAKDTTGLWYERLIMVYRLLERSRTYVSAVDALFVLENRGTTTVDCRTAPFLLPLLVPRSVADIELTQEWLAQDYVATQKNPKAIRDIVVRGPESGVISDTEHGFVFKGVLRPGESVSFTQHSLRIPQSETALSLVLSPPIPVSVAVLRTAQSRFYTPLLSINDVNRATLDKHAGLTYHSVLVRRPDPKQRLQFTIARLPVPTDHAVWLATYSIATLAGLALIVLIAFEVRKRVLRKGSRV